MINFVEQPKKWNLAVYRSVADVFDELAEGPRGKKGLMCTAALLMFMRAGKDVQNAYMEAVRIAADRIPDEPVYGAANTMLNERSEASGSGGGHATPETDRAARGSTVEDRSSSKKKPRSGAG